MARVEDKTLNTLRVISERRASPNYGSIVTNGGISIAKNIDCNEDIIATNLIIRDNTKIAGDTCIGGTLYCPDVYTIDEDTIRFHRNLVPGLSKNPLIEAERTSLGTIREPWDHVYANTLYVGKNAYGTAVMNVINNQINLNEPVNFVDSTTNIINIAVDDKSCKSFIPIHQKWRTFQSMTVDECDGVICITTSNVIVATHHDTITLNCDASLVPDNVKVVFYFLNHPVTYQLYITRHATTFKFESITPVYKVKLIVTECDIIQLN